MNDIITALEALGFHVIDEYDEDNIQVRTLARELSNERINIEIVREEEL